MSRSKNFCQGGPGPTTRKLPEQRFFSPQLILQFTEEVQCFFFLQRKLYFSKDPEGVQHFPGGGGGGGQVLISIETHKTFDFPGGGGVRTPYPPSGSTHANHEFITKNPVRVPPFFLDIFSLPFLDDEQTIRRDFIFHIETFNAN